jgi:hypothetical protein
MPEVMTEGYVMAYPNVEKDALGPKEATEPQFIIDSWENWSKQSGPQMNQRQDAAAAAGFQLAVYDISRIPAEMLAEYKRYCELAG